MIYNVFNWWDIPSKKQTTPPPHKKTKKIKKNTQQNPKNLKTQKPQNYHQLGKLFAFYRMDTGWQHIITATL